MSYFEMLSIILMIIQIIVMIVLAYKDNHTKK